MFFLSACVCLSVCPSPFSSSSSSFSPFVIVSLSSALYLPSFFSYLDHFIVFLLVIFFSCCSFFFFLLFSRRRHPATWSSSRSATSSLSLLAPACALYPVLSSVLTAADCPFVARRAAATRPFRMPPGQRPPPLQSAARRSASLVHAPVSQASRHFCPACSDVAVRPARPAITTPRAAREACWPARRADVRRGAAYLSRLAFLVYSRCAGYPIPSLRLPRRSSYLLLSISLSLFFSSLSFFLLSFLFLHSLHLISLFSSPTLLTSTLQVHSHPLLPSPHATPSREPPPSSRAVVRLPSVLVRLARQGEHPVEGDLGPLLGVLVDLDLVDDQAVDQ